jgi:hypothetical protein
MRTLDGTRRMARIGTLWIARIARDSLMLEEGRLALLEEGRLGLLEEGRLALLEEGRLGLLEEGRLGLLEEGRLAPFARSGERPWGKVRGTCCSAGRCAPSFFCGNSNAVTLGPFSRSPPIHAVPRVQAVARKQRLPRTKGRRGVSSHACAACEK